METPIRMVSLSQPTYGHSSAVVVLCEWDNDEAGIVTFEGYDVFEKVSFTNDGESRVIWEQKSGLLKGSKWKPVRAIINRNDLLPNR